MCQVNGHQHFRANIARIHVYFNVDLILTSKNTKNSFLMKNLLLSLWKDWLGVWSYDFVYQSEKVTHELNWQRVLLRTIQLLLGQESYLNLACISLNKLSCAVVAKTSLNLRGWTWKGLFVSPTGDRATPGQLRDSICFSSYSYETWKHNCTWWHEETKWIVHLLLKLLAC